MSVPVFSAVVRNGQLQVAGGGWKTWMDGLEGKRVEIIVRRPRKKRNLQIEKFYRGVVLRMLCDATGYAPSELHWLLRSAFLEPLGIDSMAQLDERSDSLAMQQDFVEWCIAFAAWFDVIIPPPNRVWL